MLNFFVGKIKIVRVSKKYVLLYPILDTSPTTKLVQFLYRINRKKISVLSEIFQRQYTTYYAFPEENYRYFLGHVCLAKSPPRSPFAFCWDMVFCQEQQLFMKYRICVSSAVHNEIKIYKRVQFRKSRKQCLPQWLKINVSRIFFEQS